MRSFWSSGTGWGSFRLDIAPAAIAADEGTLPLRSLKLATTAQTASMRAGSRTILHKPRRGLVEFDKEVALELGPELKITVVERPVRTESAAPSP
jgi:hypothetical protein